MDQIFGAGFLASILRVLNNSTLIYGSEHFQLNQESFLFSFIPKVFV